MKSKFRRKQVSRDKQKSDGTVPRKKKTHITVLEIFKHLLLKCFKYIFTTSGFTAGHALMFYIFVIALSNPEQ